MGSGQGKLKSSRSSASTPTSGGPSETACMRARGNRGGLGGDRLDHPPVTHRLDDQAAPAATGHQQAAASPDPIALHCNLVEGTGTGQLEVASAVVGKVLAVE